MTDVPGAADGAVLVPPRRIAIIGWGLIGGSIALAVRERGLGAEIAVSDPDPQVRAFARDTGLGAVSDDLGGAVEGADLVIVASPPGSVAQNLTDALARMDPQATITDVASVKSHVLVEVERIVGDMPASYVPGHPMAGATGSGPWSATGTMFQERPWILTPTDAVATAHVARVLTFVAALGAHPYLLDAATHDLLVAQVSHLPQIVASALAATLGRSPHLRAALALAGPGFTDTTRLAGSDPQLWADILEANAGPVLEQLGHLSSTTAALVAALEAGDRGALVEIVTRGRDVRARLTPPDVAGRTERSALVIRGAAARGLVPVGQALTLAGIAVWDVRAEGHDLRVVVAADRAEEALAAIDAAWAGSVDIST